MDNINNPFYVKPRSFSEIFDGKGAESISLICISACESGLASDNTSNRGLVQYIVYENSRRIPALIAMNSIITIQCASSIADELYSDISQGIPVDVSIQRLRQSLDLLHN